MEIGPFKKLTWKNAGIIIAVSMLIALGDDSVKTGVHAAKDALLQADAQKELGTQITVNLINSPGAEVIINGQKVEVAASRMGTEPRSFMVASSKPKSFEDWGFDSSWDTGWTDYGTYQPPFSNTAPYDPGDYNSDVETAPRRGSELNQLKTIQLG